MVLDCDGNCAPQSWIGDYYCDDGAYGIYNENYEVIPVNLWCEEFEFDILNPTDNVIDVLENGGNTIFQTSEYYGIINNDQLVSVFSFDFCINILFFI